jgi:hypothetical protein
MASGDDLILQGGTYYYNSEQVISKSGSASNWTTVQGASGATVVLNAQNHTTEWKWVLKATGRYIWINNIQVTNYPRGSGIATTNSDSVIDACKAYDIGGPGLASGIERSSWNGAPANCTIQYSAVWNCCRMNDKNFWNYKGWKDKGGGWPAAIIASISYNARILNCWSGENHGEGIIMTRVRGGNSEIANCYARDNYSVNIYWDSSSGDSNNYAEVKNNTAETSYKSAFYKSGAPAHNFAVGAENYDGFLVGSNDAQYVNVTGNKGYNGGHNLLIGAFGKGVHQVWIDGNTASGSTWGNYKQESASYIYDIWRGTNSGF